jgi:hypothetical protein
LDARHLCTRSLGNDSRFGTLAAVAPVCCIKPLARLTDLVFTETLTIDTRLAVEVITWVRRLRAFYDGPTTATIVLALTIAWPGRRLTIFTEIVGHARRRTTLFRGALAYACEVGRRDTPSLET